MSGQAAYLSFPYLWLLSSGMPILAENRQAVRKGPILNRMEIILRNSWAFIQQALYWDICR